MSYAIPSGACSSYTHDCVDIAEGVYQTIADDIILSRYRYSCDGSCACVQNLIKANWETKHYLTEMCLSTVMNMTKYVGGNVSI